MTYYIGIVHKDADSSYWISFPDLPGCFSAGETLDELERNAIEAIELFRDDQDEAAFPARDLEAVRADIGPWTSSPLIGDVAACGTPCG